MLFKEESLELEAGKEYDDVARGRKERNSCRCEVTPKLAL